MGWTNEEEQNTKKGMDLSSKILIGIIVCVVMIIILISILLLNIQSNTFKVSVDGKLVSEESTKDLLTKIDDVTYIDIEKFAKLVKYEYHKGEYKSFTIEEDKCYVQGTDETATFYLNDNKVCKLPVNEITEDYRVFTIQNTIKEQKDKMYAPIDAIRLAFNVELKEGSNSLTINTLNSIVTYYDTRVKEWGYSSISEQDFENNKSILYGYLIVKKEESGLYKIIDTQNTKEIVSDKYNSIEFIENTKEFFVTNSLGKVGIIDIDGTTKIEPTYDSIEVLDKNSNLYLIQKDEKYGVVKSGNITVIYPEYDAIGLDTEAYGMLDSKYILLDTLIPVCKDNKYGAFDKEGNLVYKVEYDGLGCELTEVEINEIKKAVEPVLVIEECDGIVLEKGEKYGIKDITGKDLVPIAVDSIYGVENEDSEIEYWMLYKNEELNIIQRLIKAKLIKDTTKTTDEDNTITNSTTTNSVSSNISNNINSITVNTD